MNGNCEKFYVAKVVKAPHSKEEKEKKCSAPANSFCIDKIEKKPSGSRYVYLNFYFLSPARYLVFTILYILYSEYAMHGQL